GGSLRGVWRCNPGEGDPPAVASGGVGVSNRRTLGMGAGGIPLNEYLYSSAFNTNTNVVTLTIPPGGTPPPVRLGEWVLDCTTVTNPASAHGYFYRVVSITDNGNSTFDLEVQTPFRGFGPNIPQISTGVYAGQTMIL